MAEAGVQQAGEQALANNKQDLESYGIDPSSGRYAALDQASRVQTAASAAGAGNQQRQSDIATGNAMKNQAISSELQNSAFGNQVGSTANEFLGTAIKLPYSPLGTHAQSTSQNQSSGTSSGATVSSGTSDASNESGQFGGGGSSGGTAPNLNTQMGGMFGQPGYYGAENNQPPHAAHGGPIERGMDDGGPAEYDSDQDGPAIPEEASPSHGAQVDDVHARLNDGEFVMPTDIVKWKGEEFFQKLIAQSRAARQNIMAAHGQTQGAGAHNLGGAI